MTSALQIEHFYDPVTSSLTYLAYDAASRDAVVIDPVLDFEPSSGQIGLDSVESVVRRARELELAVHYTLETHAHADHLSAAQHVRARLRAKIAIGERIREVQAHFKPILNLPDTFPTDGSQFDRLLRDGEVLRAGTLAIAVIATPGHTPMCVSYHIGDAVFTGDTLWLEDSGTGRCDFPRGDAEALFRSVRERLYTLAPATQVYVGHDYQPDGRDVRWRTTIEAERAGNIQLDASTAQADYVAFRRGRDATLSAPRLLWPSIQVNIDAGRLPPVDANGRRYVRIPLLLPASDQP